MARWQEERRYNRKMMRWRALILILQMIKLVLRIELVTLAIILAMAPISPYVRVIDADHGECRYLGARGLWKPDWSYECPRIALRQHFYVSY